MKSVSEIIDEYFVTLSLEYAKEYKRDGRAFISSYKKYQSIRSCCEMIVAAYKRNGAFAECQDGDISFKPYAYKHCEGRDAQVLADVLLIIYNITKV